MYGFPISTGLVAIPRDQMTGDVPTVTVQASLKFYNLNDFYLLNTSPSGSRNCCIIQKKKLFKVKCNRMFTFSLPQKGPCKVSITHYPQQLSCFEKKTSNVAFSVRHLN